MSRWLATVDHKSGLPYALNVDTLYDAFPSYDKEWEEAEKGKGNRVKPDLKRRRTDRTTVYFRGADMGSSGVEIRVGYQDFVNFVTDPLVQLSNGQRGLTPNGEPK